MQSSNLKDRVLVRLLRCLKKADLNGFREFLQCQLFNKDVELLQLLDRLVAKVLKSRQRMVTPDDFNKDTGHSPEQLNRNMSSLYHLLTEYLDLAERRKHPTERYRYLFHAFERLDVEEVIWEKEYKRATKLLGQGKLHSEGLQLAFNVGHVTGTRIANFERKGNLDFIDHNMGLLDDYYLVSKLKYVCAAQNLERVYRRVPKTQSLDLLESLCQGKSAALPPLGLAYWRAWNMLRAENASLEQVEALFAYLCEKGNRFSEEDCNDLYGYVLNVCLPQMEYGDEGFEELILRIYERIMAEGLLLNEGLMSPFHFKNMVTVFAIRGELVQVRKVIDRYRICLANDFGGLILEFAEGLYAFYSGDLRKAVQLFRAVLDKGTSDVFWAMDARTVLWKAYFGLHDSLDAAEHDEMLRLYHSFRVFVMRKDKVADAHWQKNRNFIRVFNRLLSWVDKGLAGRDLHTLEEVLAEAEALQHVSNKRWLIATIRRFFPKNNA